MHQTQFSEKNPIRSVFPKSSHIYMLFHVLLSLVDMGDDEQRRGGSSMIDDELEETFSTVMYIIRNSR